MSILHISTANVAYIHIYLHVRIINCADVCDRDHLVCCVKYHLHSSTSHHITSSSQFCRLLCLRVRRSLTLPDTHSVADDGPPVTQCDSHI